MHVAVSQEYPVLCTHMTQTQQPICRVRASQLSAVQIFPIRSSYDPNTIEL